MSIDLLLFLVIILLVLVGIASLIDWLRERQQQPPIVSLHGLKSLQQQLRQRLQRSRSTPVDATSSERMPIVDARPRSRATSQLDDLNRRLLTVLQGNSEIAEQLLKHSRQKFPRRDPVWYYEKVLQDLERDRQ
jgi:erythromycin esterase-like protein